MPSSTPVSLSRGSRWWLRDGATNSTQIDLLSVAFVRGRLTLVDSADESHRMARGGQAGFFSSDLRCSPHSPPSWEDCTTTWPSCLGEAGLLLVGSWGEELALWARDRQYQLAYVSFSRPLPTSASRVTHSHCPKTATNGAGGSLSPP